MTKAIPQPPDDAMADVQDRLGGRTIELLIPFEHAGRRIDSIHLKATMFDHRLRWREGAFQSSLALLAALSGEDEGTLRMMRDPDVDRVLGAMMEMLPETIRSDIEQGVIPLAQGAQSQPAPQPRPPAPTIEDPAPEQPFRGISDE